MNMNCTFLDEDLITIGDRALIAPNMQIYTAFHPADAGECFGDGSFLFCKTETASVGIGNDVWIGRGAILLPGVTVGGTMS